MDCRNKHKFMIKKIFKALAAAILVLCSCEKAPSVITEDSPAFSGTMTVAYEGESFEQKNIKVLAEFNEDKTALDIKLQKVKFVPAMPVSIDVTIMDIPVVQESDGTWSFHGDGIIPWAMGGPYDTYRVDDLSGRLGSSGLEFSLGFFNTKKQENYPTSYSGHI